MPPIAIHPLTHPFTHQHNHSPTQSFTHPHTNHLDRPHPPMWLDLFFSWGSYRLEGPVGTCTEVFSAEIQRGRRLIMHADDATIFPSISHSHSPTHSSTHPPPTVPPTQTPINRVASLPPFVLAHMILAHDTHFSHFFTAKGLHCSHRRAADRLRAPALHNGNDTTPPPHFPPTLPPISLLSSTPHPLTSTPTCHHLASVTFVPLLSPLVSVASLTLSNF